MFIFLFSFSFLLFTGLFSLINGNTAADFPALFLGLPYGLSMYLSIIMYTQVIAKVRLSISWTIVQFCVLVPLLVSLLFFEVEIDFMSFSGAILVMLSILIFGKGKKEKSDTAPPGGIEVKTGFQVFLAALFSGIGLTIPMIYVSVVDISQPFILLLYSSLVMTIASFISLLIHKEVKTRKRWDIVLIPVGMSFFQVVALSLLMVGLREINGSIAYPLKSVVGLMCVYLFSFATFKEKLLTIEKFGILISIAAIILMTASLY